MDDTAIFVCGYCGETSQIDVDPTGGSRQTYVEDCQVCCRPNVVRVVVDPETLDCHVEVEYEG